MAISVDRIHGVAGALAIKAPVRVATTANIALSGLQTIDGVVLVDQDRVLVKNQTTAADNGIWVATTSSWSRALDFNGALDVVQGTFVRVTSGTTNQRTMWELTTASPVVGTSSLTFALANDVDLAVSLAGTGSNQGAALSGFKQSGTGAVDQTVDAVLKAGMVLSSNFGLIGVGDEYSRMQNLLDRIAGKSGEIEPGSYLINGTLSIQSGTHLRVRGGGVALVKAHSSLGNVPLLKNAVQSGAVDTYSDQDILIDGVIFDGNNLTTGRTVELLSFIKLRGLVLRNSQVRNIGYIGMAFAGCRDLTIEGQSRFYNCGKPAVSAEGGAALWMGAAGDGSKNYDITVDPTTSFYDNEWSAIYGNGCDGLHIGGRFRNNKESTIFCNNTTTGLVIKDFSIKTTTKKNISSSGIELGSSTFIVEDGTIVDAASSGISLTDCQVGCVQGVTILNASRDAASFPTASGIDIITTGGSGAQPRWLNVSDNTIVKTSGTMYAAIGVAGTGAAVANVSIQDNEVSGSVWSSGKPIAIAAGKWGTDCVRQNNNGSPDIKPKVSEFQTNAAPGSQSITGIGFKPRRLELHAIVASAAALEQSSAVVDAAGAAVCHALAADGAVGFGTTFGNKAINVVTPGGVNLTVATFTSYDDDGFTINLTTTTSQAFVRYVAYP